MNNPSTIAYNGGYGIFVDGDPTTPDILNPFIGNSIFYNANNAIALANNGNDLQSQPLVSNAVLNADGYSLMVEATAPLMPSLTYYRLDFYLNNVDNSPITEGQTFLGYVDQVPSGTTIVQYFPLSTPLSSDVWVSATATNLNNATGLPGDTSPYSANLQIQTLPNIIPGYMFQF
jgi:hypothetical protein